MKKLLTGLMATTLVISTTSSLVACSKKMATAEIYLITDAGKVTDKSFNESGFKAGNTFLEEMVSKMSGFEKYENKVISKIEPENTSTNVLKYQYTNAKNNGAKVIILPGFHHSNKGEGESWAPKIMGDQGSTIMLDGPSQAPNEIGFMYRGDISGFYAGMGAIIWSLKDNPSKAISMGSFGGMSFSSAVDNFIVGYLAAIDVFNQTKEKNWDLLKQTFDLKDEAKTTEIKKTQKEFPNTKNDPNWYSNSFAQGDGKVVTEKLIEQNATVIMPVAGPQTLDVLGLSKENKGAVKVVGVDTNQAESFESFAKDKYFITSAEKDLVRSTIIGLAHTDFWMDETDGNIIDQTANHDFIKDKISITENVKDTGFREVDLAEKEKWTGKTLWVGGSMSYGGNNLLQEQEANKIKEIWNDKAVTEASKDLFITIKRYDEELKKPIIAKEVIEAYAKKIMENKGKNRGYF